MNENPMSDTVEIDKVELATLKAELREAQEMSDLRLRALQGMEARLGLLAREADVYRANVTRTLTAIDELLQTIAHNQVWTHAQRNAFDEAILIMIAKWLPFDNAKYIEDVNDIPF